MKGHINMKLKEKIISYTYTAGFGFVLCLMSAALVGSVIGVVIMLFTNT